jgi:hypothetical protein
MWNAKEKKNGKINREDPDFWMEVVLTQGDQASIVLQHHVPV